MFRKNKDTKPTALEFSSECADLISFVGEFHCGFHAVHPPLIYSLTDGKII